MRSAPVRRRFILTCKGSINLMNLKQIDAAIAAYQESLDEAGIARLGFFRTLWEALDDVSSQASSQDTYRVSDIGLLDGSAVFERIPVDISADELAAAIESVAGLMAEHDGLSDEVRSALSNVQWTSVAEAASVELAGSEPAAFVGSVAYALEEAGAGDDGSRFGAIAAMLALRALLDGAAREAQRALQAAGADRTHALTCPVCGGEPTIARVGDTDASQGRGRELWCGQCGTAWAFERIRCARCGTRNQGHLHTFSIEGDDAHRIAVCDECGGYIRTVYQEDALAPFSFEVEDVVMAPLDAVAATIGSAGLRA